jgi:hypothetical protein
MGLQNYVLPSELAFQVTMALLDLDEARTAVTAELST